MAIFAEFFRRAQEEEEEEKKGLGLGLKAGIKATAPTAPPKPAAPKKILPAVPAPMQAKTWNVRTTPSSEIRSIAKTAALGTETKSLSPLQEYFKMVQERGIKAVNERVLSATSLWRRYYQPYDGPSTVWALASSRYSMPQLEQLSQYAYPILFNKYGGNENYLPGVGGDGSKDRDLLRAVLGAVGPTREQLKQIASVGTPAKLNTRGYRGVNPMDVMGTHQAEYEQSAEYQSDLAFLQKTEDWATEMVENNGVAAQAVQYLQQLTGVDRAKQNSWQDWEGVTLEARNNLPYDQLEEFDRAFDTFAQERSKWQAQHHQGDLNARGVETAVNMAKATVEAAMMYFTASGIGAWSSLRLGGKFFTTLAGTSYGGMIAGGAGFDPGEAAEKLAEEQLAEFEGTIKTVAQRRYDDYLQTISDLDTSGDRASIKAMQQWAQEPILAEDGTIVRPGLGVGLIADGLLTNDWKAVFADCADYDIRAGADLQSSLIAGGYASDDTEITGTFETWDKEALEWVEDPVWTKALERAQEDWAAQQKLAEDHPYLYTFLKQSGLPMSTAGLSALGNRMTNEGWPYVPLKALVQTAYTIGGVYNAVPALIEFNRKLAKNPERQQLQTQLTEIVSNALSTSKDIGEVPFDIASESMTPAKAQYLVETGAITDETAIQLVKDINQNEMDMLAEPSYGWVGMWGYGCGDYEQTKEWLADNYNTVHAANMVIDILGQIAVTKTARMVSPGRVVRVSEALLSNHKASSRISRIAKEANKDNPGGVQELIGGTHAAEAAKRITRARYQWETYTSQSRPAKLKAQTISAAAKLGDKKTIVAELGEFGKTKEGIRYADALVAKATKNVAAGKSVSLGVANKLAARQRHDGDIWGKRDVSEVVPKILSGMWSGADGTYYDIFPQFVRKGTGSKNATRAQVERMVAGIPNKSVQAAASAMLLPFYRGANIHSFSVELADFPNRVADWVGSVTNDVSMVNRWRTKATLTDFTKPTAVARFEAELQALRGEYLVSGPKRSLWSRQERPEGLSLEGSAAQLSGLKISKGAGQEAEFVGRYKEGTQKLETVMQTSQLKHEVMLGRDVMLAKVKTKGGDSALSHGYDVATNATRRFERAMTDISTPLRIVNVGAGAAVLFQKHSFADTMRSVVNEGLGVLDLPGNRRLFEANIALMDNNGAIQRVLFERKVSYENEQHYNLEGGIEVTRQPRKAFDRRGRPKNMSGAIDTVRRIVSNKAYQAFVAEGGNGLVGWVKSAEGQKFLKANGFTRKARARLKALDQPTDAKTVMSEAGADFIMESLEMFGDYANLSKLSASMMDMAAGKISRTDGAIRQAIIDAYKTGKENPTVDVPIETGNTVTTWFARATKAAMTPNRLNRDAVFSKVFNEVFDDLYTKQGVNANDAGVIAATVARARTNKVHFDLSQGLRFEMKHRWVAWFGTKHRLWNTWLLKAAATYPGYSAAINEYAKWMEERNSDESIPEWEKHNTTLEIGGKRFTFNLAPYAWLLDYAIESPFALLIEEGMAHTVNKLAGTDLKPSPNTFGFSLTRFDDAVVSLWRLMHAPSVTGGGTEAEWTKFIEDLPEKEREDFSDQVTTVWALSNGEKSIAECAKEVLWGNVTHEAYRFLKPAASKVYSEKQVDLMKDQIEYNKVAGTPDASKWLALHPNFAMTIGAGSRNPYDQQDLTSALTVYRNIKERYAQEAVNAMKHGKLMDSDYAANLYDQEQAEIDKLKADVPVFADWMDYTGESLTYAEVAHYAFPAITAQEWEDARIPTATEQDLYRDQLEGEFEEVLASYGLVPGSTSLAVKLLRHRYIDIPMAAYAKSLPSDLTDAVRNNARLLAVAEYPGFTRSTQYIEIMTSKRKREMLLSGTKLNKPDVNNLLMAMLTPAEKKYAGWNTDTTADNMWLEYALRRVAIETYTGSIDKTTSTTVYKQLIEELDTEVEANWLDRSETFAQEWTFSHLPLNERMRVLGFGQGTSETAKGWDQALDIISQYHNELANTYNKSTRRLGVGPTSSAAASVSRKYLAQLVSLTKSNEDWYNEWKTLGLGPSKFGFTRHWRLTNGLDYELWANDEVIDESEYVDLYGE